VEKIAALITGTMRQRCVQTALAGLLLGCQAGYLMAALALDGMSGLSPAEQYRQLNLVLMVSEGMQPAYLDQIQPLADDSSADDNRHLTQIQVEDFQTPLNRIVDQDTMISNAARVFRFAQDNREDIQLTIQEIAETHPEAVAEVNLVQLAEDAIIVRTAISSSLEYGRPGKPPESAAYLQAYQDRTIYLRNVMEYWSFTQELAELTEDAMDATGGRMEAYQRMLEDEPALDSFRQHLQAVEYIYWQTTGKKVKPPKLPGDELIDAESQVN
jgi:hypothetical protein